MVLFSQECIAPQNQLIGHNENVDFYQKKLIQREELFTIPYTYYRGQKYIVFMIHDNDFSVYLCIFGRIQCKSFCTLRIDIDCQHWSHIRNCCLHPNCALSIDRYGISLSQFGTIDAQLTIWTTADAILQMRHLDTNECIVTTLHPKLDTLLFH